MNNAIRIIPQQRCRLCKKILKKWEDCPNQKCAERFKKELQGE